MKTTYNILRIVFILQFALFILSGCEDGSMPEESVDTGSNNVEVQGDVENADVDDGAADVEVEDDAVIIETDLGTVVVDGDSNSGELVKVKEMQMVSGGGKIEEEIPEDLPSIDGAANFTWAGAEGSGMLTYKLKNMNFTDACEEQTQLLAGKGWTKQEGVEAQHGEATTTVFEKEGDVLSLTCTEQVDDENGVVVTMVKGPKST